MHVLLLVDQYPPHATSAARLYAELAEDLLDRGHEVSVVTTRPEQASGEDTGPPQADVHRTSPVPGPKDVPFLRVAEHLWTSAAYLKAGLRVDDVDAILVYSPPLFLGWTGHALARYHGAPWVLNVQDLYPDTAVDLGLLEDERAIALARKMEGALYERADAVTVHSEGNREHVLGFDVDPEDAVTIPNWVEIPDERPSLDGTNPLVDLDLDDRFVVFYGGTMGFAQGLGDVLEAADHLRDRDDVVFLLLGGGSNRDRVVRKARSLDLPNVRFHDPVPPQEYERFLLASDVALVPLREELATPVVPGKLQAIMAAGKPALATTNPVSDAKRIVEASGAGVHVEAGDPEALARTIEDLAAEPDQLSSMGKNGYAYARAHFNRRDATAAYAKLLEDLAAR